ncbi:hypothetical protein [Spiroplasma cantharicola]|uniref:Transmembrane protein n=1 Tax=Spiroplasma cantharicola TaxID=362837 RepID=A0A0M4JWI4_9MOLU|nr:hypothetical protein [Spiroplasma cantharicola]ALD66317.1 hypothetical protein SCANT_v1c04070 [Spiroplasma cantharicola]
MKKIISMLSVLTLGVTGVNSVVVANQYRNNANEVLGNQINWNKLEENLLTMFDGILDESNENKEMLLKAREESLKYYDNVKNNNLSLDKINSNLTEMSKKYENQYKNEITRVDTSTNKVNIDFFNYSNYFSNSKKVENYEDAKASLSKFSKDLAIAQNTLSTLAVVAGIAAAGFWAAAWWFGISIPWAVAATAVGASLGVASASIGFYRQKHNLNPNLLSAVAWSINIRTLASAFKEIVYPVLIMTETTVTASSWAVPAALAAVGAIFVIYAWVSEFA